MHFDLLVVVGCSDPRKVAMTINLFQKQIDEYSMTVFEWGDNVVNSEPVCVGLYSTLTTIGVKRCCLAPVCRVQVWR